MYESYPNCQHGTSGFSTSIDEARASHTTLSALPSRSPPSYESLAAIAVRPTELREGLEREQINAKIIAHPIKPTWRYVLSSLKLWSVLGHLKEQRHA